MRYKIPYEVPAETPHAAIIAATDLLRHGVEVEAITRVAPSVPGWYFVDIAVAEDEPCQGHVPGCPGPAGGDHVIDHPADATAFGR